MASADAVGIDHSTLYTDQWKEDEEFQEAKARAETMAADLLVDEAKRRAVEGTRSYQFTKDGDPIMHPDRCDCGHHRKDHDKTTAERVSAGEPGGPCLECTCDAFRPRPYVEHSYSDTLMKFLLQGLIPETYGKKVELKAQVAGLDLSRLPDHLLARIADGEHPMAVLASASADAGKAPGDMLELPPGGEVGEL